MLLPQSLFRKQNKAIKKQDKPCIHKCYQIKKHQRLGQYSFELGDPNSVDFCIKFSRNLSLLTLTIMSIVPTSNSLNKHHRSKPCGFFRVKFLQFILECKNFNEKKSISALKISPVLVFMIDALFKITKKDPLNFGEWVKKFREELDINQLLK